MAVATDLRTLCSALEYFHFPAALCSVSDNRVLIWNEPFRQMAELSRLIRPAAGSSSAERTKSRTLSANGDGKIPKVAASVSGDSIALRLISAEASCDGPDSIEPGSCHPDPIGRSMHGTTPVLGYHRKNHLRMGTWLMLTSGSFNDLSSGVALGLGFGVRLGIASGVGAGVAIGGETSACSAGVGVGTVSTVRGPESHAE